MIIGIIFSLNDTETEYIIPRNLDESKEHTTISLGPENDENIVISNSVSNINDCSSGNYSAQYIASLQNIKEIKDKMISGSSKTTFQTFR